MFKTTATVKVKNDAGKIIAQQDYDKVVFEGISIDDGKVVVGEDIETLLAQALAFFQEQVGEKGNGVLELLKNATYANDLGRRAAIRQSLVNAAAGPDKAIEKAIKDLMAARQAAGKPITLEVARTKVQAMMADD